MMIQIYSCDICGYTFTGKEHWSASMTSVDLKFSASQRAEAPFHYDHLCLQCVEAIKASFVAAVQSRTVSAVEQKLTQ